jgi:hypothetical protein
MKAIVWLMTTTMIIMMLIFGLMVVTEVITIHTLGNRVEDSLISAGWTGFSEVDFDKVAKRKDLSDEEDREVFLKKIEAKKKVREYIKENLKLDAALMPKNDSYIIHKSHPVIIDEITIVNPDELPVICNENILLNRTTIHIKVRIPMDVKWVGFRYIPKHVDVDIKSFYKD